MNIAIIPARGGSKRIPRKNIKKFHGKPIIAYSIEAALQSGVFDRVIVSTDDSEIAKIANEYGAEVPFVRPKELSCDHTATVPVIKHAIEEIEQKTGTLVENACCIYATAPFVGVDQIKNAYKILIEENRDYCFPVVEFDYAIQRALEISDSGDVSMNDPKQYSARSQDLKVYYHDVGQFYFGKKESWVNEMPVFLANTSAIIISKKYAQDIDTEEDWEFAEYLYSMKFKTIKNI